MVRKLNGEDNIEIFLNEKERLKKNEQKGRSRVQNLSDDGTKGESQMFLRYKEWNALSPEDRETQYEKVINEDGTYTAKIGVRDPSHYVRKVPTYGLIKERVSKIFSEWSSVDIPRNYRGHLWELHRGSLGNWLTFEKGIMKKTVSINNIICKLWDRIFTSSSKTRNNDSNYL